MTDIPRTPDGKPELPGRRLGHQLFPGLGYQSPMTNGVWSFRKTKPRPSSIRCSPACRAFRICSIDPEAHVIMGEHGWPALVRGERRTRLIVVPADGKLPLTDEARALIKANAAMDDAKDDYEQRPNRRALPCGERRCRRCSRPCRTTGSSHHPDAEPRGDPQREWRRGADHTVCGARMRGGPQNLVWRFDRALGGRHAGGGDDPAASG